MFEYFPMEFPELGAFYNCLTILLFQITVRDKANMDFCVFNCNDWFDLKRKMMKKEVPANVGGKDVITSKSVVK